MYVARPLRRAYKEGEESILRMNEYLTSQKRYGDLERATADQEYRKSILAEMESRTEQ